MKTIAEHIIDNKTALAAYIVSSDYSDDEANVIIEALKEYVTNVRASFKAKMIAGRIVESIEKAMDSYTEITPVDFKQFMTIKCERLSWEVKQDKYCQADCKNEEKSNESNK